MRDVADIKDAARLWIEAGYWVAPVVLRLHDGKKAPRFPGGSWQSTNNLDDVDDLFYNVDGLAVDTGRSGVVVIDVDMSETKDGIANLHEAGIKLPQSVMRGRTWSGGHHGYFRQTEDPIKSGQNKPVAHVDFRGLGGLAFAWPSVVIDPLDRLGVERGRYDIEAIVPVAELDPLPEYFASLLRPKPSAAKLEARTGVRKPTALREDQISAVERYLESDLTVIRQAVSGARNEALSRTLVIADRCIKLGLDYAEFEARVLEAYTISGGEDDLQAINWCRSAWTKALADPLTVPRTRIDTMADERHDKLIADRLARARLTGATAQLVTERSFVDWTKPPEPPRFWVSGVIPQGEQVILYGKPEAGKTFTALDWAMSASLGRRWFGRETERARVWFMAGEGNTRITSRMHAWIKHHGVEPGSDRIRLLNHVPDLMSDQVMEDLAQRVAEHEVDLVLIDTLGRAMNIGGGDISDPADAGTALKSLATISKYRPSTTPVAIHHPIKDGGMAGAYNLLAGVDVSLFAEVDHQGVGTLRFAKNKDGEKTIVCRYRWKTSGSSAVLVPADVEEQAPDQFRS